ncbi:MAG: hypothetical protein WCL10_19540, partial [Novosphingobium sp.]
MELTFIGAVQVLAGLALFVAGSVEAMFAFALCSALFGGSAAILLPVLGGSSIPPVQFALLFVAMRLLVPGAGQMAEVGRALRANGWLLCFVVYGVIVAFIAPRLFAGQIDVTPLRGRVEARYSSTLAYIYAVRPLAFSPQNLTTAVYLAGTLLAALASFVACGRDRGRMVLVRTLAVVGMAHALTGFASVALKGTPIEAVLALFRNATYAQLDHSYLGFELCRLCARALRVQLRVLAAADRSALDGPGGRAARRRARAQHIEYGLCGPAGLCPDPFRAGAAVPRRAADRSRAVDCRDAARCDLPPGSPSVITRVQRLN